MAEVIDLTSDNESDSLRSSTRVVSTKTQLSYDTGLPFGKRVRSALARRSRCSSRTPPDTTPGKTPVASEAVDDRFTIATEDNWNSSNALRTTQLHAALTQPFAGTVIIEGRQAALKHADEQYDTLDLTNKLVFWTDGSYKDVGPSARRGCGVAIVWRALHYDVRSWEERGFSLGQEYGSNGAEFFAIAEALKYAVRMCEEASLEVADEGEEDEDNGVSAVTVYTDSQHALRVIDNYHTGQYVKNTFITSRQVDLARLRERARKLVDMGVVVELRWVPSHTGIDGNVRADMVATRARENIKDDFDALVPPRNGALGLILSKGGTEAIAVDPNAKADAKAAVVKEAAQVKKTMEGNAKKTNRAKKSTLWNRFAHLD